jgi:CheY-like chemotaxis protein
VGRSILVVDEDESTSEVVATGLVSAHGDVQGAASALEAKAWLQQHAPALIIADLGMPVEDGFSLIRDIRTQLAPGVPAIALSAYADQPSRDAALAAGFDAFLAKPARADALLQLVGSLLKGSNSSTTADM